MVETHVELKRRRSRATPMDWRAEVEPQACRTEEEKGNRQTEAEPEGARTIVDLEERKSPWRQKGGGTRHSWRTGCLWHNLGDD